MDAPKCRLCGKRHWGQCAAVSGVPEPKGRETEKRGAHEGARPLIEPATTEQTQGFDRKAYQREYMKRARAEGKWR